MEHVQQLHNLPLELALAHRLREYPPRPLAQQGPRREPPASGGLDTPGHETVQ